MIEAMLTTIDNPHDPFEEWAPWYAWDRAKGYGTVEFLDRIMFSSDELTYIQLNDENTRAIDEIISENSNGLYKKVTREVATEYDKEFK